MPFCASELLGQGPSAIIQPPLPLALTTPLQFVVKRHHAKRLHTDLRLEAFGVLLSWAFDELPTLDPGIEIGALEMPDHQLRYLRSERRIPDGQPGAGPVVVWDHGTYRPIGVAGVPPSQTTLDGLRSGRLDFRLQGQRLAGDFRMEIGRGGWRFSKLADRHSRSAPSGWEDRSILTARTLDDLEAEYRRTLRPKTIGVQPSFSELDL